MENKQQTAVEWFAGMITEMIHEAYHSELADLFEQAKAMDKQQKEECWNVAHQAGRFEGKGIAEENWQTFQQYYTETYGNP
jgi:hypothetical protein